VLVPPGTERWIQRIASPRKPLVWSGTLNATDAELARRRAVIERATREGPLDEGLLALGPVFDQFDPAAVAAALYQLWTRLPRPALNKQIEASTAAGPRTRLWVGAGKKDDLAVGDLVGLLINDLRMDRSAIGKIEMRDTFSLVEVPTPEAERIAQALSGRTLRRRRLVARVDRKP
jgi:ATP-dependent RNA helicase DeaD